MFNILMFAQEPNIPLLEIDKDSTVVVRSVIVLPDTLFLYGEKFNNKQYGGENDTLFKNKQITPNKDISGVTVDRNDHNQIILKIVKNKLQDTVKVSLVCAYEKNINDWWPNNKKNIYIYIAPKQTEKEPSNDSVMSHIPTDQTNENSQSKKVNEVEELETAKGELFSVKNKLIYIGWLSGFNLICIVVLFVLLYKSIKKRSNLFDDAKIEILDEINKQISQSLRRDPKNEVVRSQSNYNGLSKSDIESLIDSKINIFIESRKTLVEHAFIPEKRQESGNINNQHITENCFDTEDVIFDTEKAIFRLGQTDIKIFRIYSKGFEFYYTISDNNNIRTEFIDMIPSFTNFVTIVEANASNAKKVEPVRDGRLIKTGDEFMVDQNNKLELRFV